MNEEINVKFGGDLGPIGTAIRGLKGMMKSAGESIKDSFKDSFHHLTAPLSIAGAFEAVRSLVEDVKNVKRISESTGLDTGVTQDLLNLGKASGIAGDAIEAAMDKFVKNLAPGSDPEQALYNLADRMAKIEDPTERARLAVENFGKSGVKLIPILEQGSDGIRKMSEEWGKLSEAEIDELEHANQTLEKKESRLKVGFVRLGSWIAEYAKKAATIGGSINAGGGVKLGLEQIKKDDAKDVETEMAMDNAKEAQKVENAKKAAQEKKDAGIKAAKELSDQEEIVNAKPQEKVLLLTRKILELRREMEDSDGAKEQAKLSEKMLGYERERKSVSDEINRNAKTASEKQKQLQDEIAAKRQQMGNLQREAADKNAQFGTLQEVANSGFSVFRHNQWEWQSGPLADQAQQTLNLEARAHRERLFGNKSGAEADEALANKLREGLESAGAISPQDHLKSINDKTILMQRDIATLTAKLAELKKSQE